jgi:hypothetical protein
MPHACSLAYEERPVCTFLTIVHTLAKDGLESRQRLLRKTTNGALCRAATTEQQNLNLQFTTSQSRCKATRSESDRVESEVPHLHCGSRLGLGPVYLTAQRGDENLVVF